MQAQVRNTVYVVFLLVVSLFGPNVTTAEALPVDQLLTPITYTTQPGNTEGQPVNAPAFMDQSGTDNNSKVPTTLALPIVMMFQSTATYYVSPSGSDVNSGTFVQPWRTIQKAASTVASGSTVIVTAGSYAELISVGKSNIKFIAEGKVEMKGFYVSGNDNLISGFTITNPSSDFGIRVSGDNNTFEKNDISNTGQDGIWFFGSGNKFVGNYVHDIVDRSKITSDPHVDCFQTWGPAENIVFEKNICDHTSTSGSNQLLMLENITPPVRNIVFRNNVLIMHDPGYSPLNFARKDGQQEVSNMYVVNNTIVHVNGIGSYGIHFKNITGAYAVNNVFIDYGNQNSPYILVEGGSGIKINNNAIYKSDNVAPRGGAFSNDVWMQNLGLVNRTNYDFHLVASSPLIDRGENLSGLVSDDFEMNMRPVGNGYDIGAFEFTTTSVKSSIFADVPADHWAANWIERLYQSGITGGCQASPLLYCPDAAVTRAQMAIFILRGIHGSAYTPPVASGVKFGDVPDSYWAAAWIEQLASEGITGGCGNGNYCPDAIVTRAQMAIFLLRAKHGAAYMPPAGTGVFADVPVSYWAASWIEQLAAEGITSGCAVDSYCPDQNVTRDQMAVFLVRTFGLP